MSSNPEHKLNLLIAYPYLRSEINTFSAFLKERLSDIRLVLDSGAFTAWRAGQEITVAEYGRFLRQLGVPPWRYFTLDVIGDPKHSLANYEALRADGFSPIPIFTRGDSVEMIERYYETSDVLGVGGLVRTKGNKGFVKGIMAKIGKRQVHWLGFTSQDFVQVYKPYMCDSSSWAAAVRYGVTKIYDRGGLWLSVRKNDFLARPASGVCALMERYGIPPIRLAKKQEWVNSGSGKSAIELLTYRSWVRYSLDVQERFGTKLFLAVVSTAQAKLMHDAFTFWKGKR